MTEDAPRTLVDLTKARRFDVGQLLKAIGIVCVLLFITAGPGIREAGEEMEPGPVRTLVLAVGEPAGAVGDVIPLHEVADEATAWLSTDDDLGEGGFTATAAETGDPAAVQPVGPEAFDPAALGRPAEPLELKKLLVTGDSLSQPLDAKLARRLSERGVEVVRDAHIGTGVSKDELLDWGKLATKHASEEQADAVVMFIGANEGFPLKPSPDEKAVECCGPEWAALYATRVRTMMNTYRRDGAARVYWLTVMAPQDEDRREISRAVNAGIFAAVAPYRAHVRVLDMVPIFTPGFRYRASMPVDGEDTIVRESDGIHLNDRGSELAADQVMAAIERDFGK